MRVYMCWYICKCVCVCRCVAEYGGKRNMGNSWVKAKPNWLNYFEIWRHLIHPNFGKHSMTICCNVKKREKSQWSFMFKI